MLRKNFVLIVAFVAVVFTKSEARRITVEPVNNDLRTPGPPLNETDKDLAAKLPFSAMSEPRMTCGEEMEPTKSAGAPPNQKGTRTKTRVAARWPNGVVPYNISENFTEWELPKIYEGMQYIQNRSCVKFRPKKDDDLDWIEIKSVNGIGCYADIGFWGPNVGAHKVNLQLPSCNYTEVIIHELLHVLSFDHEQKRPDRDAYVTLNWSNIKVEKAFNYFRTAWVTENTDGIPVCDARGLTEPTDFSGCWGGTRVTNFDVPYDFSSIMHYAFEWNAIDPDLPVMTPKNNSAYRLDPPVGRAKEMSSSDIERLRRAYGCNGTDYSNCGGNVFANEGTLDGDKERGYEWILNADVSRAITITFTSFTFSGDCASDYLEIRYGDYSDKQYGTVDYGRLLGKYSDCKRPPPVISTKHRNLQISYVKASGSSSSWKAKWSTTELTCCDKLNFTGAYSEKWGTSFTATGSTENGKKVFQSDLNSYYCAWNCGRQWIIGGCINTGTCRGWASARGSVKCGESATGWEFYSENDGSWVADSTMGFTCSTYSSTTSSTTTSTKTTAPTTNTPTKTATTPTTTTPTTTATTTTTSTTSTVSHEWLEWEDWHPCEDGKQFRFRQTKGYHGDVDTDEQPCKEDTIGSCTLNDVAHDHVDVAGWRFHDCFDSHNNKIQPKCFAEQAVDCYHKCLDVKECMYWNYARPEGPATDEFKHFCLLKLEGESGSAATYPLQGWMGGSRNCKPT